ncbi:MULTISPECIES: molybdenum cofactor biosynthesis protein MoaE [unclassified Thermoactinomyces]|jgi:molybdopterin synthase catalytic subunit|uniref:molybdenum cofactor biosynthesis protein MoaE n=1 Tax=unclassified Thermoactinomyces TaxID=2634588 RepID=UPI0018DDAAB7|nr:MULTISPECIES: molybdenum cofactor biosynthesis protein MoaE [unclassified Thermoactinomyces]MBH8604539.1 molybdenum cofactor biosynthesis protein MoaE [Thermoactinomyces sp. CICC 10522]MBH8607458.1 molybdenum cofactor biosynthesis protein MoaE [Thermoactinomyces sp. CICC 10521]
MKNFSVTREKIELSPLIEWVQDRNCGAITTFMGTVRELTNGKKTIFLEYEAYQEMAEKMLQKIGEETLEKFDCSKIAIVHRIGRLEIGDVAVAIAVSSPHRDASFKGCRYAIEKIKELVPIWKKEHGEDGSFWVSSQSGARGEERK